MENQLLETGTPYNPICRFIVSYLPAWLERRTELGSDAKVMFARLSRMGGHVGVVRASMKTLAAQTGLSLNKARKAIHELEEHKIIGVIQPTCVRSVRKTKAGTERVMSEARQTILPPGTECAIYFTYAQHEWLAAEDLRSDESARIHAHPVVERAAEVIPFRRPLPVKVPPPRKRRGKGKDAPVLATEGGTPLQEAQQQLPLLFLGGGEPPPVPEELPEEGSQALDQPIQASQGPDQASTPSSYREAPPSPYGNAPVPVSEADPAGGGSTAHPGAGSTSPHSSGGLPSGSQSRPLPLVAGPSIIEEPTSGERIQRGDPERRRTPPPPGSALGSERERATADRILQIFAKHWEVRWPERRWVRMREDRSYIGDEACAMAFWNETAQDLGPDAMPVEIERGLVNYFVAYVRNDKSYYVEQRHPFRLALEQRQTYGLRTTAPRDPEDGDIDSEERERQPRRAMRLLSDEHLLPPGAERPKPPLPPGVDLAKTQSSISELLRKLDASSSMPAHLRPRVAQGS